MLQQLRKLARSESVGDAVALAFVLVCISGPIDDCVWFVDDAGMTHQGILA